MFADDERLNYLIVLLDLQQNRINKFLLESLVASSLERWSRRRNNLNDFLWPFSKVFFLFFSYRARKTLLFFLEVSLLCFNMLHVNLIHSDHLLRTMECELPFEH